uniref:Uncharacterized protein n=1 Tax=Setaria viridis TaxID=4556 RepID=A0A4U6VSI7_SETVI|nr:hypothetical protein SEVIR_2G061800v2 [Setaria viridis]TKW30799.1 hypothetical protein SEVIR_2G061800v2 [Setaria viridis]
MSCKLLICANLHHRSLIGAGTSGAVISPYLSLISKSGHQRGGWRAAGVHGRQQERRPVGRARELGDRRARLDAAAADRAQERRGRPVDADAGRSDGRWGGPVSAGCSGGQPGAGGAGSGRRREWEGELRQVHKGGVGPSGVAPAKLQLARATMEKQYGVVGRWRGHGCGSRSGYGQLFLLSKNIFAGGLFKHPSAQIRTVLAGGHPPTQRLFVLIVSCCWRVRQKSILTASENVFWRCEYYKNIKTCRGSPLCTRSNRFLCASPHCIPSNFPLNK